ncbi:MAG: glycosyltransferase family A protein [Thermodesulfobacteriota bacterium]
MERKPPLVTVVVPTYNHENYVIECIESILGQDYPNIELIVINDGSTDSTDAKLRGFNALCPRPFTYISKKNEGVGKTMSLGLKTSRGEYFCEVCSDDALLPGAISKRVDYLEANPEADAVFGGLNHMDGSGRPIAPSRSAKSMFRSDRHIFEDFLKGNARICFHAGMYRTSFLKGLGGFDEDFYTEDAYMSYLIALRGRVSCLDEAVVNYRSHETNISKGKPLWMRREKALALEKLYASSETGYLKRLISKYLFREYLKYVREGFKATEDRVKIATALDKALKLRPYSLKAVYYKLRLRLDARAA